MMKSIYLTMACVAVSALGAYGAGEGLTIFDIAVSERYVWSGTSQGLLRYDKTTDEVKMFSDAKIKKVSAVGLLPEGEVAVGDSGVGGVAVFDGKSFRYVEPGDGIGKVQTVGALSYDSGLWIGCATRVLHQSDDGWKEYVELGTMVAAYFVYQAFAYDDETATMWYGASGTVDGFSFGSISAQEGMKVYSEVPAVNDLYRAPSGMIYIATDKGMWYYADGKTAFLEHPISAMPEKCTSVSGSGEMLCFSAGNVLVKADDGLRYFSYENPAVQSGDYITDIEVDGDVIWVGYRKSGLFRFKNDEFESMNSSVEIVESGIDEEDSEKIYDLRGFRLTEPVKGEVYIQSGKKRIRR